MSFKKILLAVDFSPPSREAMTLAASLAVESGSELAIAHVFEPSLLGAELPMPAELTQKLVDGARNSLREWMLELQALVGREVKSTFLIGAPWHELVTLLGREHFDLAVLGTHGRTGLKHVLLGSVAERVVRHAPCAVLVVRNKA